ncbi:MAG TPA: alpha-ketoglutarate-dependent dioxygenase AlkB [Flavitalea sp.]|nr:alpha-ketoglutarate-dependent dioxygenase AlkB [Flavitalea sp.]
MNTLFPAEPGYPEGFEYVPQFLTEREEKNLVDEVVKINLTSFIFQGFEAKRRVASFGYDYSFDRRSLSKGKDIPRVFCPLIEKVASHLSASPDVFAELLVTEYPVGSVINWHRDAPPFDIIAGISLNADCVFRLRPHEKTKQGRGSIISMPVKRRSLYIMHGSARSNWQHSIAPVKDIRYSITLRTLKTELRSTSQNEIN